MELSQHGIPIIDLKHDCGDAADSTSILNEISFACKEGGCFYIRNHGISSVTIDRVFIDLRHFFSQSLQYKTRFIDPSGNLDRGYEPFESRNVNAFMGRLGLPNDPVEKYAFGPPYGFTRQVADNIWPDVPPTIKESIVDYYLQIRILAEKLLKLFAVSLPAPSERFFYDFCSNGEHTLRANFYPEYALPKPMQSTRFGEHTDGTPFTILAMDDCRQSLQVLNVDQEWVYADPIPGTLFVNLGDFMARWTNDKWKANVHKVVWGERRDRLSLAYFIQMNPDAVVECIPSCVGAGEKPKYEPISYSDYVNARMARLSGRY